MQDNVVGTELLIHISMDELTRAMNTGHTTLYKSINILNSLNFNMYLQNLEFRQWKMFMKISHLYMKIKIIIKPQKIIIKGNLLKFEFNMLGDIRTEDEKFTLALDIAYNEISKDKLKVGMRKLLQLIIKTKKSERKIIWEHMQ